MGGVLVKRLIFLGSDLCGAKSTAEVASSIHASSGGNLGGLSTLARLARRCRVKAMKLVVKGVNLTVTPSLRRHADEKLVKTVEKLLGRHPAYGAAALELELIHATHHHRKGKVWQAVANLQLPAKHVWQRASGEDIHSAIDELEDNLKRELTKYKERSRSREFRGARQAKKDLHLARSARLYRKGRIRQEGN